MSPRYDVVVVGHVACDRNVISGVELPPAPGGAAYYASMVHLCLGLRTLVVTKVATADEDLLLGELRVRGAEVVNLPTPVSTVFRNIDAPERPTGRRQRVDAIADPIRAAEIPEVEAGVWQLGPLTNRDMAPALVERCARARGLVAMDVQGLIRAVVGDEVRATRPERADAWTRLLNVLKADEEELVVFSGIDAITAAAKSVRRLGVAEVLLTRADRGSTIFGPTGRIPIQAVPPRREVDATGCGDTYLAAYLARRLESDDLAECGNFASAVAGIKIEDFGPFRATPAEVAARRAALARGDA